MPLCVTIHHVSTLIKSGANDTVMGKMLDLIHTVPLDSFLQLSLNSFSSSYSWNASHCKYSCITFGNMLLQQTAWNTNCYSSKPKICLPKPDILPLGLLYCLFLYKLYGVFVILTMHCFQWWKQHPQINNFSFHLTQITSHFSSYQNSLNQYLHLSSYFYTTSPCAALPCNT